MASTLVGPVKVSPELRAGVDISCQLHDMTLQDFVVRVLEEAVAQDAATHPVAFQALREARRLIEEARIQSKSA